MIFTMDHIDRKILALLQEQGRASITEVATAVSLSVSATHRRVRDLEQTGVISGYRATIAPAAVGLEFEVIVFVTIDRTDSNTIGAFEDAVSALPRVVEAERLFGEPDYMLRVLAPNLTAYQEFYDAELGDLPGVLRLSSTLVMKRVGPDRTIPLDR